MYIYSLYIYTYIYNDLYIFMYMFVHHTTNILAKLSTWCFEHSGDINCSILVKPSHADESWEGRNTCLYIYTYIHIY